MALTDTAIRAAKPRAKPYKLTDSAGLHLLVTPGGAKLWKLAYRFLGKQRTLAFGPYPIVGLADARAARDDARKLLANDVDPSVQRKITKHAAANTFKAVGDELLAKMEREGRASQTLKKTKWLLELAYADIGQRPIGMISAPEVLLVLRKVEARAKYETARRLRSTCSMVFRYAIGTTRAERDPTVDLRGALTTPIVKHRPAIIEPQAIGHLLRAIDDCKGQATTKFALRLVSLVFVRPGELRHAEWQQFDFDAAEWRIPAEIMKMRRPHRVPLSRQALAIVRELQSVTGHSRFLFPSVSSVLRPISENTLNNALRRMGFASDEMCVHGFRTTASTCLNEMRRWSSDAIERQLAHEENNAVRRAYMHGAEFWRERVAMMQAWADYLDELRLTGNVLPFVPTNLERI